MNPVVRKLERRAWLTAEDRAKLAVITARARRVDAKTDLVRQGDAPRRVHLVLDGFACRYKLVGQGARQILGYLLPGDFCDLDARLMDQIDYGVATVTPCSVAELPGKAIDKLAESSRNIARALRVAAFVDHAILREWLAGAGLRPAGAQIAHLLCEIHVRLDIVGLCDGTTFAFPVTQQDIGDALGITTVHTNRCIQLLRDAGLITLKGGRLTIHDVRRLRDLAEFDDGYLHLQPGRAGMPPGPAFASAAAV